MALSELKGKWDTYWQSMRASAAQAEQNREAYVQSLQAAHDPTQTVIARSRVRMAEMQANAQERKANAQAKAVATQEKANAREVSRLTTNAVGGQLIKTYKGKNMDRDFQYEANKLAADGWRVQSQTYGGSKGPGLGAVALFGVFAFAGKKRPSAMTVIYTR